MNENGLWQLDGDPKEADRLWSKDLTPEEVEASLSDAFDYMDENN